MSNINQALRKSVSINFIGRYANVAVQLGVMAVLARMLAPPDFGVMAIVAVLMTFFSFIAELGLGPAVIQFQGLEKKNIAGIFWITLIIGIVIGAVFAACGPLIASFYNNQKYIHIAWGLGVTIAVSCWTIVPLALLRRCQQFRAIIVIEFFSAVASGLAAVVSAYDGMGVFALVTKSWSYAVVMFLLCLIRARPPVLSKPSVKGMGHVFRYSTFQFLFTVVNYFTRNLDKLIIGKVMGPIALGLYDLSYRLMLMPVSNLTFVITPALQPIYSAHQKDPDLIFRSYQKLVKFLIISGGFVGALCLSCSSEIIVIVYGKKWVSAIPIFYILSFSIAVQVVASSTGAIFQAIGRTDLLFRSGVQSAVIVIIAVLIGVKFGTLTLLAWIIVVVFSLNSIQQFYLLVVKGFGRPLLELFKPSLKCMAGILVLQILCAGTKQIAWLDRGDAVPMLMAKGLVLTLVCVGFLHLTGDLVIIRHSLVTRRTVAKG